MTKGKFRPFPFRLFLKEYMLGTDGINSILISAYPVSVHSQNAGNVRECTGTDGLHYGMRCGTGTALWAAYQNH